jgi:hypothetical protein
MKNIMTGAVIRPMTCMMIGTGPMEYPGYISHATWSIVMAIMAIIFKALPDKPFLTVWGDKEDSMF